MKIRRTDSAGVLLPECPFVVETSQTISAYLGGYKGRGLIHTFRWDGETLSFILQVGSLEPTTIILTPETPEETAALFATIPEERTSA